MNDNIQLIESGELQLRKAFEDVATRNIQSILLYAKNTRHLQRDLEKNVKLLEDRMMQLDNKNKELNDRITRMQIKNYQG